MISAREIFKTVFGLLIVAAGAYVGFVGLHQKPIELKLIYVAAGGVFFGALLVDPAEIFDAAKKFVSLLPSIKIGSGQP